MTSPASFCKYYYLFLIYNFTFLLDIFTFKDNILIFLTVVIIDIVIWARGFFVIGWINLLKIDLYKVKEFLCSQRVAVLTKWDLILGIDMKFKKKGQFYFNAFFVVTLSRADFIKIVMFTHSFTIWCKTLCNKEIYSSLQK